MPSLKVAELLALTLLAVSFSSAQNAAQKPKSFGWSHMETPRSDLAMHIDGSPADVTACPLGMRVRQGVGGQLLEARNGQQTKGLATWLHLTLYALKAATVDQDSPRVVYATVTVSGLNGRGQIRPAGSTYSAYGERGAAEIRRTMTVRLSAVPDEQGASSDLILPGFSSARVIEVNSVTYADGSTEEFSGALACRAVPDPLMRVASL